MARASATASATEANDWLGGLSAALSILAKWEITVLRNLEFQAQTHDHRLDDSSAFHGSPLVLNEPEEILMRV